MKDENNNDKVIVLGTLKKEKSSKPIFVIIVFILLIGTVFAFPYIKAYLGDDFNINDLLNKKSTTTKPITSTTTTTTTTKTSQDTDKVLTCIYRSYSYEYTFVDDKLVKIYNTYSFNSEDPSIYNDTLKTYQERSNNINNLGGNSKIITLENNTFMFESTIDKEIDLTSIDSNYFALNTNYDTINNELTNKGFDCK